MKPVFRVFVWGRGGFSLLKSGRLKSPLPREKIKRFFNYAKLNSLKDAINLDTSYQERGKVCK